MPRLFTALEIPSTIATQLTFLQSGLDGARWIEREDFHVTLRFIGDVDNVIARELHWELQRHRSSPLTLEIDGLDVFGGAKPRSIYARIKPTQQLQNLHHAHEQICQRLGRSPDGRKFTPHVTIARVKGFSANDIARYLSPFGGFKTEAFQVDGVALYSAKHSTGGGPYVIEGRYSFDDVGELNA